MQLQFFYRIGKWHQEQMGQWIYGNEEPKYTLSNIFRLAGLKSIQECSIGHLHALEFIKSPENQHLINVIKDWYKSLSNNELVSINQGYLLVTRGCKR